MHKTNLYQIYINDYFYHHLQQVLICFLIFTLVANNYLSIGGSAFSSINTSFEITAGKNVTITSVEGDAVLQAAKVTSGTENLVGEQNVAVNATNGNIYLLAASNSSESTHTDKSKGTYSFSDGTSGHINSEVVNNEITAGNTGSATFNTENQIIAQYKNTGSGSDVSVFADDSKLSYLSSLDPAKTTYDPLSNQTINWDQTTRGLTSTGTAVIAVAAVAAVIATGGAAAAAAAGAEGAVAAGAVAGGAIATGAGAGAATIASTVAATAAVSATNASMNADGNFLGSLDDVGKTTLKDTTSDDALRNYAIAGITAGVTAGISEYSGIAEMSRAANTANTVDGARTAEQVLQNAKVSLYESAISNTTSTVVQSAVNGESPSDTLSNLALNIAVGAVANAAAKEIGNAAHGSVATDADGNILRNADGSIVYNAPRINTAEQLTLHAALGCASGAAQGGNCASGAASGVMGEITGSNLRSSVEDGSMSKQTAVQLAGLSGAAASLFVSAATGQSDEQTANNIFVGQRVGSNAAENNAILFAGKYKIPFTDNIKTKDGKDYALHVGVSGDATFTSVSMGTDGMGRAGNLIPVIGGGIYANLVPQGENVQTTISFGGKDKESYNLLKTYEGGTGYGVSFGYAYSPTKYNITVDIPTNKVPVPKFFSK